MLDLGKIDLSSIAEALEDHSDETTWWFDPGTGEVESWSAYFSSEEEEQHPGDRGLILIEPLPSGVGYRDMEDFIARVRDPRSRDLLQRAIEGRGAFRRFKDTLFEFPELRAAWFAFHDARTERRALEWLADEGVVDPAVAEREMALRSEPEMPELGGALDPEAVARAVADDLRELYGARLRSVILFGSWARGEAHPESDIDLLVVLDRVDSFWKEEKRMRDVLWRHSFQNDTLVSATAVGEEEFAQTKSPFLIRARVEGHVVG